MRRNELTLIVSLVVIGLLVAFWLVVLGPKRQEASGLKDDVDQLQGELDQAQQSAAAGQEARRTFPTDYRKLVVLGKAVPQDGDQASLLVQLQKLAERSGVEFQSIDLSDSTSTESTAPPTTTTPPPTSSGSTSTTSTTPTDTSTPAASTSTPAPVAEPIATEASAATLPIGATVGAAGLPVMGYEMKFDGGFFQIADFLKRVDAMVRTPSGRVVVDGRLLTVDAFTLAPIVEEATTDATPTLTATLLVTSFLTPAVQGTTDGATPSGPAPATTTSATPTPASTTAPTTSSTPTSSTTP